MEKNEIKTQFVSSTQVAQPNPNNQNAEIPLALGPYDILFYIFRHKKKIISFALLGLAGAVTALLTIKPDPVYKSYAKLLVDYVITRHMADEIGTEINTGKSAVDAELEIFTSWDLSLKVAEEIGPENILTEVDEADINLQSAATSIQSRLSVGNKKGSQVISVSYEDKDPGLVVEVLKEFVKQYFIKHLEVHRSGNAFREATQRVNDIQWELSKVEEELTKLRAEYGIISLDEQLSTLLMQRSEINARLTNLQSELVSVDASFAAVETTKDQPNDGTQEDNNVSNLESLMKPVSDEEMDAYRRILARIDALNKKRIEILSKYKEDSVDAKNNKHYLDSLNEERIAMLKTNPNLERSLLPSLGLGTDSETSSLALSKTKLESLKAQVKFLEDKKKEIDKQYASMVSVEPKIKSLQVQISRLEDEYNLAFAFQQETLSDQSLFTSDSSEIPNIDVIQYPSAALLASGSNIAIVLAVVFAGGGVGFGVFWALLIELFIDTTIKRASEIKLQLHMPLMLSIPMFGINRSLGDRFFWLRRSKKKRKQVSVQLSVWDPNHFLRPFADAMRDRTDYEFEVNNVKHKPKLIALTSFSDDVGTSTLAASLAASFTEVVDAKVLFVNLSECSDHHENNQVSEDQSEKIFDYQRFLQNIKPTEQEENLFVTKVSIHNQKTNKFMSKRLDQILPQLRQSDFDYVILDMPVISPVSPIISIAYRMDKTILVVGAEKTTRNDLKNNYEDLIQNNAKVSIVLNKTKRSLPLWLQR